MLSKVSQKPKGMCFVDFEATEQADKAVALSGRLLKGEPCLVCEGVAVAVLRTGAQSSELRKELPLRSGRRAEKTALRVPHSMYFCF